MGNPVAIGALSAPSSALRAHRELFDYWSSLRRRGRLPARADISPEAFKRHLPTVSLIDVDAGEPERFRLRLAGTGLYGLFGREITGLELDEAYPGPAADYWRRELATVTRTGRPGAGVHALDWRDGAALSVFWLRLPLASDGERVDMILGYDAVIGVRDEPPTGVRAA